MEQTQGLSKLAEGLQALIDLSYIRRVYVETENEALLLADIQNRLKPLLDLTTTLLEQK